MHKIAILKFHYEDSGCYECCKNERVLDSISDWQDVSDEEFDIMVKYQRHIGVTVVEKLLYDKVEKDVAHYLELAQEQKKRYDESQKKAEERKVKIREKNEKKRQERERIQFEELKRKFAEDK